MSLETYINDEVGDRNEIDKVAYHDLKKLF